MPGDGEGESVYRGKLRVVCACMQVGEIKSITKYYFIALIGVKDVSYPL